MKKNNLRQILEEYNKKTKEKVFFIAGTLLFALFISFITIVNSNNSDVNTFDTETGSAETATLEGTFAALSKARTNSCGGGASVVYNLPDDGRIQGSCCTTMNYHKYQEQIEGLKKYAKYEVIIPNDPYDVSVLWAREMIEYNERTKLNTEQQLVYDQAVKLSHEGGPCCCVCWHWYAYEGLAKKLIIEHNFTAEQIAEVWDLSDACGGTGHQHGGEHV